MVSIDTRQQGRKPEEFSEYYICIPGSLELFQNLHRKTHSILLKTVDLCLEMSSDFNYYFGFVVEEIFELGHAIKSRCFDTNLY